MDINEYIANFTSEVQTDADAYLISREEAFFINLADKLKESEAIYDYEVGYFRKKGRQGRQIEVNGFSYDDADGTYNIFVVDELDHWEDSLTNTDIDKLIKRAEELVYCAVEHKFLDWEESSYGYLAASNIYRLFSNLKKDDTDFDLKRVRIFILTNKTLSKRFKNEKRESIHDIPIEYSIYDASRLYDMAKAGFDKEPVNIVLKEYGIEGIYAIKCAEKEGEFESYLTSIPGEVLSNIYLDHGTQVLEGNVRAFLSVRGKVNKGIRQTIIGAPDKFFILNNGITVTSDGIEGEVTDSGIYITQINDIQIVNGGQTTASLANAKIKSKTDLSKIQVMMKLSVFANHEVTEKMVPEISRASNSQNKVDEADFFSNHPFHIKIEELSKKVLAPSVDGNQYHTTWFYERARGQYDVALMQLTSGQEKSFKAKNPKKQVMKKTDLAKYFMTYEGYPHETSKGAQKAMREFSNLIQGNNEEEGIWAKDSSLINEQFFKDLIAKALFFRDAEKIVSSQEWYKEIKAYRANIVAYTVAILAWYAKKEKVAIDLSRIWTQQKIYSALEEQTKTTAKEVYENLLTWSGRDTLNVTEWAKKVNCWKKAQKIEWTILPEFTDTLVKKEKEKKSDVNESTVDAMSFVMGKPVEMWEDIKQWGKKFLYLTPNDEALIDLVMMIHTQGKIPGDKKFKEIVKIYNSMVSKGYVDQY